MPEHRFEDLARTALLEITSASTVGQIRSASVKESRRSGPGADPPAFARSFAAVSNFPRRSFTR